MQHMCTAGLLADVLHIPSAVALYLLARLTTCWALHASTLKTPGEKATNKDELFKTYQPVKSRSFGVSLLLEFLCVALFQFLGGSVTDPRWAPWTNGLSLAGRSPLIHDHAACLGLEYVRV